MVKHIPESGEIGVGGKVEIVSHLTGGLREREGSGDLSGEGWQLRNACGLRRIEEGDDE
jgi:hypothetical protein